VCTSELRVQGCGQFTIEGSGMCVVHNTGCMDVGSSELKVQGCRHFIIEGAWMWAVHK
jgi:hypothetical protein